MEWQVILNMSKVKKKKKVEIIKKKLNLENELKEVKRNITEIKPNKKDALPEFIDDEFEDDEIEFGTDFSSLLDKSTKNVFPGWKNIQFGDSLEGGIIFAPRFKTTTESEGKVYFGN